MRPETAIPDILDTPLAGPAAVRGGALRVLGYGAGVVLTVGSAALLFRHLGVVDSGRYVTVLSLVALVGGLTDAGLTSIGVREWAVRDAHARHRLLRNLLGLRLVLTLAGVALATIFAAAVGYGGVLVVGTALAGFGLLLQILQSTLAVSLMSRLRLGLVAALDLFRQLVTVVLVVALVLLGSSLVAFLALPIAAGGAVLVLTVSLVRRSTPTMPSFELAEWRELLKDALPFVAATAVAAVYLRVAVILVSLIASAQDTGYFGASFRIVEVLILVPQLMVSAAFPIFARAARDDPTRFSYAVQRVFEAGLLLGAATAVALALGAELVIDVVGGAAFQPAADLVRIQGVALLAAFAGAALSYALLSMRRHRELLYVNGIALAANVVLTSALTAAYGALGAAVGVALAELMLALGAGLALARVRSGPRLSFRLAPRIALAAAAALAVAALPGLPAAGRLAAGIGIYAALVLLLRAVPPELLLELRARAPATR